MPLGPRDLAVFARAAWRPERPDRLVRAAVAAAMSGPTVVGAFAAATARYPRATAIIDPRGALSYVELWRASDAACSATPRGERRVNRREGTRRSRCLRVPSVADHKEDAFRLSTPDQEAGSGPEAGELRRIEFLANRESS